MQVTNLFLKDNGASCSRWPPEKHAQSATVSLHFVYSTSVPHKCAQLFTVSPPPSKGAEQLASSLILLTV